MKHEFLENLNNCNENTSFLYNENEFPSYPVPVGRRLKHLHQQDNFNKVNILRFFIVKLKLMQIFLAIGIYLFFYYYFCYFKIEAYNKKVFLSKIRIWDHS